MRSPMCSFGQSGMGLISTASSWSTNTATHLNHMQRNWRSVELPCKNSKRKSNPTWCVYYLHECTLPHQLVDIKQRAQGVCSLAVLPGWSGPAPRDCLKPSAPPLSDPGSSTASWSQRKSVHDQSHHSGLQGSEIWPGAATQAEERPRKTTCVQGEQWGNNKEGANDRYIFKVKRNCGLTNIIWD